MGHTKAAGLAANCAFVAHSDRAHDRAGDGMALCYNFVFWAEVHGSAGQDTFHNVQVCRAVCGPERRFCIRPEFHCGQASSNLGPLVGVFLRVKVSGFMDTELSHLGKPDDRDHTINKTRQFGCSPIGFTTRQHLRIDSFGLPGVASLGAIFTVRAGLNSRNRKDADGLVELRVAFGNTDLTDTVGSGHGVSPLVCGFDGSQISRLCEPVKIFFGAYGILP